MNGKIASYGRVEGQPFAKLGTFAAGWNDRCAGNAHRGDPVGDYDLGYSEAMRLKATAGDAYNQRSGS